MLLSGVTAGAWSCALALCFAVKFGGCRVCMLPGFAADWLGPL